MGKFRQVPLNTLTPGMTLSSPVVDPRNPSVKLLAATSQITEKMLQRLRSRGVDQVIVSESDLATINTFVHQGRSVKVLDSHEYAKSTESNDHSNEADKRLTAGLGVKVGDVDSPILSVIQTPDECGYDDEMTQQWCVDHGRTVADLHRFFQDATESTQSDSTFLRRTCDDILNRLLEDKDAVVCVAGTPFHADYPTRHSVHVASLAMAMGIDIGLDRERLIDLGIGCLIHDLGMTAVGVEMFDVKMRLSPKQLQILSNHPVRSVEIAGKFGNSISEASKLVAYQIHERCDGSGYPRGFMSLEINTLAKIAAVADAFVALCTPRKHRYGVQGHFAIKKLLEDVQEGKLDPYAMRALLQVTSLFPIGSCVTISGDRVGRVIRSNVKDYANPTIEMWHKSELDVPPAVVNLKFERKINIVQAIPALDAA